VLAKMRHLCFFVLSDIKNTSIRVERFQGSTQVDNYFAGFKSPNATFSVAASVQSLRLNDYLLDSAGNTKLNSQSFYIAHKRLALFALLCSIASKGCSLVDVYAF
jgi:hypothetical protein